MSLSKGYVRTSLFILNIKRGLVYIGVSGEFENGKLRISLVILNIDRGLA